MSDAAPLRLLLVDDDPLVRAGLGMILGGADDFTVVAEAPDGARGVALVDELRPDIVLMDIRMPRLDGVSATRQILSRHGDEVRVIVLTTFDTDELVLRALRAGASGFLLKDTPPADLVAAVRAVAAGKPALSPAVTATLIAEVNAAPDPLQATTARKALASLTPRELEVAKAVGEGKSNAEISEQMYLSVPTVKAYVSRLLDKLDCSNRVQIAILVHDADSR